jgi:hypothetical protein
MITYVSFTLSLTRGSFDELEMGDKKKRNCRQLAIISTPFKSPVKTLSSKCRLYKGKIKEMHNFVLCCISLMLNFVQISRKQEEKFV